jgi:hypothetical protein
MSGKNRFGRSSSTIRQKYPAILKAETFSNRKLSILRAALAKKSLGNHVCVVATGSFGRREACADSDVDFFVLHDNSLTKTEAERKHSIVEQTLKQLGMKLPSQDGAFNSVHPTQKLIQNVGGSKDSNRNMTLRLLLLLEGTFLFNSALFEDCRVRILERYVGEGTKDHGLARFLLNDIIRYYRTMCVDFEYKTVEQSKGWAVRNLKLLYSRKLLYFGGVFAVAETAQQSRQQKLATLLEMLSMPPLTRVRSLCGIESLDSLNRYETFLMHLSNPTFRAALDGVTRDRDTHTSAFRDLKNESIHFSWALAKLLHNRYPQVHPIHLALTL